jgi:alpha-2-macroglobulin
VYRVRATNAGTFGTPPAYAEGMYDATLQARGTSGTLQIVKP